MRIQNVIKIYGATTGHRNSYRYDCEATGEVSVTDCDRHTVRVTIKFPANARPYGYGNRRPRQTGTCVRDKRVQASETNGNERTTNLERASDKTGTDHTTAVGSCRECWRIPANDTYVQVKSNESAYKGVKSY